jgi:hypothetical protein
LNYGERFGDQAIQAVAELDFDPRTLINTKSIASRFPRERRRRDLSFNHHAAVAYLDPRRADDLLEQAAAEHWTVKELREATRETRVRGSLASSNEQAVVKTLSASPRCELTSSPEESLEFLKLCQRSVDLALHFKMLALHPTKDRIVSIMESATALMDALTELIEACERIVYEPS